MNYGLYLSATGMLTSMHRQNVIANNLANVTTVGFKEDRVHLQSRLPERMERSSAFADPSVLLENLGGGHEVAPTSTVFKQGALVPTGNKLDMAIRGDGFFVVNSGEGGGAARLRFTRDGRFTLNRQSELVLATNGMQVLDANDEPIRLRPDASIQIQADGRILQDGRPVAQLQVTSILNRDSLRKQGQNLFIANDNAPVSREPAQVDLEQGFLESSTVDPVMALNQMTGASRAASANARLIQYHDDLTDKAVNRLARVA